jgi:serine/threonine protein kinase/tetratricopeptide (TPR) repeat protein
MRNKKNTDRPGKDSPDSRKKPGTKKASIIEPGTLLAKKYKVVREIGSGGMGTVYLAEDINLGRKAAIKTLSDSIYKETDLKDRFNREARALSAVEHPNICTIYEIFEEKNREFIVMQYIDGKSLDEIPQTALTIQQKIEIIYQVALGLRHAHNSDIIHRDIKPSNIRIDTRGTVKILDFGLAKRVQSQPKFAITPSAETIPIADYERRSGAAQTKEGIILGTIYYMSPEQARGEKVDNRSDIFSLGTVMYELVTGKLPYPVTDTISALFHIVNTEPYKIGKIISGVPKRLSKIINKALEKDPLKRYQSLDGMINDLERLRAEIEITYSSKISEELKTLVTTQFPTRKKPKSAKDIKTPISPVTTVKRKLTSKNMKIPMIAGILAILTTAIFITGLHNRILKIFVSQKTLPPSIVVINKFETTAFPSEVGEAVQFLLIRSLSQLPGVWFIDDSKFGSICDKLALTDNLGPEAYNILKQREGLYAIINGTIQKFGSRGMIEIAPRIIKIKDLKGTAQTENIRLDITPVAGQEDILLRLVDEISGEVVDKMGFKGAGNINDISTISTNNWQALLLYMQAEKAWALRKTEETADLLNKSLKYDKSFLLAEGLYGELEKFKGNNELALQHLKKALSKSDKLTYADRLYFQSLEAELELDYQRQMDLLRKLSAYRPLDWNTSYALAESYFHRGKIVEAKKIYYETLHLSPKFSQALNHLGYCLSYLGEHEEAIEILKEYKTLDETYNAYDSLGDGYYYAGDYQRAELYKIAALQKNPNVDWIYRSLADIYLTVGRVKSALEMNNEFKKMAKGNKRTLAEALLQRAYIYMLTNRRLEAKALIDQAKSLYRKQEIFNFIDEMQWISGIWYLEGGQISKAREELSWLGEIVKKYNIGSEKYFTFYKYYLHLKALCDYYEGKTADARETMNKLINLGPKLGYWITYHHLSYYLVEAARMEYEMKSYETAEQYVNQALSYIPDYPYALYYLAKISGALGNTKKANETFRAYLEVCKGADTDYPPIYEAKKTLGLLP